MAKRKTAKELSRERTKKVRAFSKNGMATLFAVMTGHVTNQAVWMYDVHKAQELCLLAIRGDYSRAGEMYDLYYKYQTIAQEHAPS